MDLLLDMSSRMQAMEEYASQHSQHSLTGIQGSIPERSSIHARPDAATATSSARAAAACLDRSSTIASRVTDEQVPETVRRKLARHLRWTPLLVESCTDKPMVCIKCRKRELSTFHTSLAMGSCCRRNIYCSYHLTWFAGIIKTSPMAHQKASGVLSLWPIDYTLYACKHLK